MTYPFPKNKFLLLILLGALLGGCRDQSTEKQPPRKPKEAAASIEPSQQGLPRLCPTLENPRTSGTVEGEHLTEISGVVVSRSDPGVMWVHNDSGDAARVYGLDFAGNHIATLELPVAARDFEDIALDRSTEGAGRIYVADTGDNSSVRDKGVLIHRFLEPKTDQAKRQFPRPLRITQIETMRLRYPNGPRDAEALLVDPWSGQVVILTKPKMDPAEIFVVDNFVAEATPTLMGRLAQPGEKEFLHLVTGADITADGRWIVVRTYERVALFARTEQQSIAAALAQKPCLFTPAWMPQAEAIGVFRSRREAHQAPTSGTSPSFAARPSFVAPPSFVTLGEGKSQPIHVYDLKVEAPPR